MNWPKISVITPSLNQGKYLEDTIKSVFNQNYPNLEYILIDGASTDSSVSTIEKYEKQFQYWVSEPDTGQSNAVNKGFAKATGEIVTWLGSDDILLPGSLQRVAEAFTKDTDVALVHGDAIYLYSNGKRVEAKTSPEGFPNKYLAGMAFAQPSSFFRRSHLEKVGFLDETLHYGMDYDLMVRLFDLGKPCQLSNFLSVYRYHPESKSTNDKEKFAEEWAWIFSKVVYSIYSHSRILELMQDLQLYHQPKTTYEFTKAYTDEFLYQSFLHFLHFQIIFLYQSPSIKRVKPLLSWLKENERGFFDQQRLLPVYNRVHYLNNTIIKYARRFSTYV
ncbi:MAG: glycosyltransferase family 2 protein [Bacteroidota bacterium]